MLFMDIWTWEPEKRIEAGKRAMEWQCPEGIKVLGYWMDITGNRAFYLYEVDDPKVLLAANNYWLDIATVDSVPVLEGKDAMEVMQRA